VAEAAAAALRWMLGGYSFELTGADVRAAFRFTMESAARTGRQDDAVAALRELMGKKGADDWVAEILQAALATLYLR